MDTRRTRYEILVATLLNKASLAAFRLGATPTAVPRRATYRLRVPADRDLSEVLHRLTDHDVQVLEIRQCTERGRAPESAGAEPPAPRDEPAQPADVDDGVVIPFPRDRSPRPLRRRATGRLVVPTETTPIEP